MYFIYKKRSAGFARRALRTNDRERETRSVSFRFFLIIFLLPPWRGGSRSRCRPFRSPKRSLGALKAGLASRMQYKKKVN